VDPEELKGILDFLRVAERLKTVPRSGWTTEGERESVAAHSWRLCLMAMLFYGRAPHIDLARLMRICLVHDLGEALRGDVPAPEQSPDVDRAALERSDLVEMAASLPPALRSEITALWDDYAGSRSPEARLARGLDKLETILQHTQGRNPPDFDYAFNLQYGRQYTGADPLLETLREVLDGETRRRAEERRRGDGDGQPAAAPTTT
jgi:putative hydrolases of HD superfamily